MDDVKTMLEEINQAIDDEVFELTAWETDFIGSVRSRVENDIPLSPKQDEALERIWKRATRND